LTLWFVVFCLRLAGVVLNVSSKMAFRTAVMILTCFASSTLAVRRHTEDLAVEKQSTTADVRVLMLVGAGDKRVDGKLVLSGSHRGRPEYSLADENGKLLIFWSDSDKQWRVVFSNFLNWNRETVYANDDDTDSIPLKGWKSLSMSSNPPPKIEVTWAAAEKEPVSQEAAPNDITGDRDDNDVKFEWIGLGVEDVAEVKSGKPLTTADDLDGPTCEMLKTKGQGCSWHDKKCKCRFVGPKPKTCDKLFKNPQTVFAVKGHARFALFGKEGCKCSKGKGFNSECDLSPKESI